MRSAYSPESRIIQEGVQIEVFTEITENHSSNNASTANERLSRFPNSTVSGTEYVIEQALKAHDLIHIREPVRQGPRRQAFRGETWLSDSRPASYRYPFDYFYTPALLFVKRQLYNESIGIVYDNEIILYHALSLNLFGAR